VTVVSAAVSAAVGWRRKKQKARATDSAARADPPFGGCLAWM